MAKRPLEKVFWAQFVSIVFIMFSLSWVSTPMMLFYENRVILGMTAFSFSIILVVQSLLYFTARFITLYICRRNDWASVFLDMEEVMCLSTCLGMLFGAFALLFRWEGVSRSEWLLLLLLPFCLILFSYLSRDSEGIVKSNKDEDEKSGNL